MTDKDKDEAIKMSIRLALNTGALLAKWVIIGLALFAAFHFAVKYW